MTKREIEAENQNDRRGKSSKIENYKDQMCGNKKGKERKETK